MTFNWQQHITFLWMCKQRYQMPSGMMCCPTSSGERRKRDHSTSSSSTELNGILLACLCCPRRPSDCMATLIVFMIMDTNIVLLISAPRLEIRYSACFHISGVEMIYAIFSDDQTTIKIYQKKSMQKKVIMKNSILLALLKH